MPIFHLRFNSSVFLLAEDERKKDARAIAEEDEMITRSTNTGESDGGQQCALGKGLLSITVDGKPITGNVLPVFADGKTHDVTVEMV